MTIDDASYNSNGAEPQSNERQQLPPTLTITRSRPTKTAIAVTLVMGIFSIGLYFLLFIYADTLTQLAMAARSGDKLYAIIPICIALLFSFVHGIFTGKFWDLLGLKAKK